MLLVRRRAIVFVLRLKAPVKVFQQRRQYGTVPVVVSFGSNTSTDLIRTPVLGELNLKAEGADI
jgi:hypothetical protein